MQFYVEYFKTANGSYPAEEFILTQNNKIKAKIFRNLELLENKGNELREPYSKHLEDGIFELRTKQGTDTAIILYFFFIDKKIILTNGFIKKTQKTPKNEIDRAKKYRTEYLKQEGN